MNISSLAVLLAIGIAFSVECLAVSEREIASWERDAVGGDRKAVAALLDTREDGHIGEEINVALGKIIPLYPQLFLEELAKSIRANCARCLPDLLGNLGEEYVDNFVAQAKELRRRRNAIASVTVQSLTELRERCVEVLERQIDQAEEIAQSEVSE